MRWETEALRVLGYRVSVQSPCHAAQLRRHGRPAEGRHSLQITVRRSLYMHEGHCERHAGFDPLVADLGHFVRETGNKAAVQELRDNAPGLPRPRGPGAA